VTIRATDPTDTITAHSGARGTSYLQAGDRVTASTLPQEAHTLHGYWLCVIDGEAANTEVATVVALGDSLTDGRGSPTDGNGVELSHGTTGTALDASCEYR
jgi:hypothetical protein